MNIKPYNQNFKKKNYAIMFNFIVKSYKIYIINILLNIYLHIYEYILIYIILYKMIKKSLCKIK